MLTEEKIKTLPEIFEAHKGLTIHKYPHHLGVYERYFSAIRARGPVRMLEIGIGDGGSLQLWRTYFGANSVIFGSDVQDLKYLKKYTEADEIIVGDQGDKDFLGRLAMRVNPLSIIIDDGSHKCDHQIDTFRALFPVLVDGGIYAIEDIHTSYRKQYNFGGSFVEYLKELIDDMHRSELGLRPNQPCIFSLAIYPNLAVIQKRDPAGWGGSTMRPVIHAD